MLDGRAGYAGQNLVAIWTGPHQPVDEVPADARVSNLDLSKSLIVQVATSVVRDNRGVAQRVASLAEVSHRDQQLAWYKHITGRRWATVVLDLSKLEAAAYGKVSRREQNVSGRNIPKMLPFEGVAVLDRHELA